MNASRIVFRNLLIDEIYVYKNISEPYEVMLMITFFRKAKIVLFRYQRSFGLDNYSLIFNA